MSSSIRFLGLAVLAWAGVRAASLGLLPGTESFAPAASAATTPVSLVPPLVATEFALPGPPDDPYAMAAPPVPVYAARYPQPVAVPVYWGAPAAAPRSSPPRQRFAGWSGIEPSPGQLYYPSADPDPWPVTRMASAAQGSRPVPRTMTAPAALGPRRLDRLQLTAWALLRGTRGIVAPNSLASGGTLGGSQAGARLTYNFTPSLAASLRSTSSAGGVRGAEVAAGVRWQPLRTIPVALTFERRQGLGRYGGRSAFAVFAEGGLYQRPVFGRVTLDAYAQAGVVGLKNRDLFVDGGATFSRPVWKQFSAGFGVWGGAQPGLYRIDAGPRASMDVRRGIKVHLDYRQRLIGNAAPASGPAVTIAGDF